MRWEDDPGEAAVVGAWMRRGSWSESSARTAIRPGERVGGIPHASVQDRRNTAEKNGNSLKHNHICNARPTTFVCLVVRMDYKACSSSSVTTILMNIQ